MENNMEITVDVYGDFACFTQSDSKVERVTYDVITPSAARNILSSIYAKPKEFYYEILKIEVMKPIRYIDIRRNEVYKKATNEQKTSPLYACDIHTQRGTVFLKDVYYRIHAMIHKREDCQDPHVTEAGIYRQFMNRLEKGKCFQQPYLGQRECMCFFLPPDVNMIPIQESKDLGVMLYDIFSITNNIPLDTDNKKISGKIEPSYYHPYMINGVINVPRWGSKEIFR